jgi:dTMP kinase
MSGTFITIEGIEGAGKSTIAKRLLERLESQGRECLHTREPGGTQAGEKIREILLNPEITLTPESELLLFEAARRQIMEEQILPALNEGKTVVLDRFYDSTTAYQGYGRGLDLEWINQLNLYACHNRKPDITILLDIDVQTGLQRAKNVSGKDDRFESEKVDFMERIRQGFLAIADNEPQRFVVINVEHEIDEIWSQLVQKLQDRLQ